MKKCIFSLMFLNKDILLGILYTVFKIDMLILDTMKEGALSQILYLCPKYFFMECRK